MPSPILYEDTMFTMQKLSSMYIHITDNDAVKLIKMATINSLRYEIIEESDESCSIVAKLITKEKRGFIIEHKKTLRTRTPGFLLPFIGKEIVLYTDYLSQYKDELFRIKPINFKLNGIEGIKHMNPYLTKSALILPFMYINKMLDYTAEASRISFNRTNDATILNGELKCEVVLIKQGERFNYPFYKCTNGLTTKTLVNVIDLLMENNKNIENFEYKYTLGCNKSKYGVIIFKEKKYE